MNYEQIRRLCEYAEDGWDILQVGIQPEVVISLLDRIEELEQLEEYVETVAIPNLLYRTWTDLGVNLWLGNHKYHSIRDKLDKALGGLEQTGA